MVISGVSEEEVPKKIVEINPKRSRPLHNFSLPCLKWGNQKLLRCMKVNSNGENSNSSFNLRSSAYEAESEGLIKDSESEKQRYSSSFESLRKSSPLPPMGASGGKSRIGRDGDDGPEGNKVLVKIKFSIPEEGEEEESSGSATAARPWNLRKRRAACKIPKETGGGSSRHEERKQKFSPQRTESPTAKLLRSNASATAQGLEKKKQKFSISLSREEIEDDLVAIMGTKPSRRPKKRPKIVQKRLDMVFPGLWLSEITADSYKVLDELESKKSKG